MDIQNEIKSKELLSELHELIGNYNRFAQIAIKIPWFPVKEEHEDWFHTYPCGICIDLVHFPPKYVNKHFREAFVRTSLCAIGASEEWDKEFWNIPFEERKKCLYGKHSQFLYDNYINFKDVRLQLHTEEYLQKKVSWFAEKNGITPEIQKKYFAYIHHAIIVELGGSYTSDYTYLVVKEDTILLIDCGIWD